MKVKINELKSLKHIQCNIHTCTQCIHAIDNFDSLAAWLHNKRNFERNIHIWFCSSNIFQQYL